MKSTMCFSALERSLARQSFSLFSSLLLGLAGLALSGCNEQEIAQSKELAAKLGGGAPAEDLSSGPPPEGPREEEGGEPAGPDEDPVILEERVNTFQQKERFKAKVDILWVVDNSGSMRDDQRNLSENLEAFLDMFIKREHPDFRLAVTSTDPRAHADSGDGQLAGQKVFDRQQLLSNESAFIRDFEDIVKLGVRGSGREVGLQAIKRALERNQDVFREDAMLAVNIISDEHDSSVERYGKSVQEYVDEIKEKKKGQRVVINSIVRFQDGSGRYAKASVQQIQATELTKGVKADIFGDYASALMNIGDVVSELIDNFALEDVPHSQKSLKVEVDGQEVHDFSYNGELNLVKFNSPPRPGAEIQVTYQTAISSDE